MMPLGKKVADLITWARLLQFPLFVWLGLTQASEALPVAVGLVILNWTADSFDGPLARRKPFPRQTQIGARDLEVDMLVSCGLLAYLTATGLLGRPVALFYLLIWGLYFGLKGISGAPGMLFQAPIYGWFIVVSFREAAPFGWLMVLWIGIAMAVTWPRFPREMVPGFLKGMRAFWQKRSTDRE